MTRSTRRFFLAAALWGLAATAQAQSAGIAITGPAGTTAQLSLAELQALPAASVTLKGEHGTDPSFAGPMLWTVLERVGAIDPNFHKRVGRTITATGRDGYAATLAMGEIDPEFEGKSVLLAIDPEKATLRIAIPGDKRLGRDVRDVVSLAVR